MNDIYKEERHIKADYDVGADPIPPAKACMQQMTLKTVSLWVCGVQGFWGGWLGRTLYSLSDILLIIFVQSLLFWSWVELCPLFTQELGYCMSLTTALWFFSSWNEYVHLELFLSFIPYSLEYGMLGSRYHQVM